MAEGIKDLVELMARSLVDHPEQVSVQETVKDQTVVLELRVAADDIGKVIGRQGRTARSLRTILGAAGTKLRKRLVLEIVE